eukprot:m.91997 g.91997  ORF g.91997 m.91997 type:complete len:209 (+) comp9938_c0_seq1:84-710(+)
MSGVVPVGRLVSATTRFFCCDLQERFRPTINHFPAILQVAGRLIQGANAMSIPVTVTEQYPKALGHTVGELQSLFNAESTTVHEKTMFSMLIPEVLEELHDIKSVVLFGIETHICVQQTALDLRSRGFDVHVIADGCSSRTQADRMVAFERMRQAGVFISTHESVLFELLQGSQHPNFKEVSSLISKLLPESGLTPAVPAPKKSGMWS